ncbi:hypothetical protein BKA70DRAFT_1279101 [Coprinopsis sp. MPI-PUGE-AT-0042]|nr:hypothetical protein BKA70DRAFT_1279101 [Coprinopsis sp. MPI-PUGE-AT-0042]
MDSIIAVHIALQVLVWGVLFPVGMVLGLTRSRWHVPIQSAGYLLTIAGYVLGATRNDHGNLPGSQGPLAYILLGPITLQLVIGIYLQLRINVRSARPYVVRLHGIVGKIYPILAWIQMLAGAARLGGYCEGDAFDECLAHYGMGSSFIAYGVIMSIMFLAGETWVRRSGRSPDFYDSCVMTAVGMVNTFAYHERLTGDIHDMQHTTMGLVLWAGGILGILLSRNNKRSVVPSVILIIVGWSMGDHAQHLALSTKVHIMFGRTLIMAGITRIVEVCYFAPKFKPLPPSEPLTDDASSEHTLAESSCSSTLGKRDEDEKADKRAASEAWRHLPPFLFVAAGILLMSATDDELEYATELKVDHVTYILIMFSFAFLLYALTVFLIHLYQTTGRHRDAASTPSESPSGPLAPYSTLREPATSGALELAVTPTTDSAPWGWRWWHASRRAEGRAGDRAPLHVIGEDDEEDECEVEKEMMRLYSNAGSRV